MTTENHVYSVAISHRSAAIQALDNGNAEGFAEHTIAWAITLTVATARSAGWDTWKERAVCKYVTKTVRSMERAELALLGEDEVEELIEHAADGFDAWCRRRSAR